MNDENELLEPLATEAGQEAIVRAIRDISSLEYAVRAELAASTASAKAGEASQSALEASEAESKAKDWATKTDTYVEQLIITIPPAQEGEEPTTETINLYSAKYYAALALDIYNNMSFDSVPTENSTNMVNSGVVYSALDLKADKSTTYTKTEVDTALGAKADLSTTYTKTEVDTLISTAVSNLVNSAPSTLDTLEELADALGDDPNFATTIATQLGNKADKSDTYTKTEVDTALSNVQSTLTFDNVPTANSDNPVKSSGIKTALDGKQDTLTFDSTPTANSTNPVTSGGVYTALQNVNIDIDDEITEDSDNPVTSAAIYEALLNFTPSGGGGAGNASGVTYDILFKSTNSQGDLLPTFSLGDKKLYDYDELLIILDFTRRSSWTGGLSHIISTKDIIENGYTRLMYLSNTPADPKNFDISYDKTQNNITFVYGDSTTGITEIYGIKFSKNLSEQMYSNVLYENSSGWSSGSITLSDALDNYDFIQCDYRNGSDPSQYINSNIFDAKLLLDGRLLSICGYGSRYFNATVTSSTVLTLLARGDYVLTKITGYKMAKGGYSGIVSDARMTVKSGFIDLSAGVTKNQRLDYNVTFDSPMPDTNYIVNTHLVLFADYYNSLELTITNKTINGFTITGLLQADNNIPATQGFGIDWIAIRPNSYTREGMVEDVLFNTDTPVYTVGEVINLSGNISDYDLIEITTRFTANSQGEPWKYHVKNIFSSQELLDTQNQDKKNLNNTYNNSYITSYCANGDNQIICRGNVGQMGITKVVGIKFGRYVSGVAVDTTITSSGTGVPSTNAVYLALLNIPSGGGSGSITIDSVPTENSQNAVSSGGVYDALLNLPSGGGSVDVYDLKTPVINGYSIKSANSAYYVAEKGKLICPPNVYTHTDIPSLYAVYKNSNYYMTPILICPILDGATLSRNSTGSSIDSNNNTYKQYYDPDREITWYCATDANMLYGWSEVLNSATANNIPMFEDCTDWLSACKKLIQLAEPVIETRTVKENLFSPTNFTLSSGNTISSDTLKALIAYPRPIVVNNETYYFVKKENGTSYYENPNNTITIDSSWVVTITAKSSGGSSITVDSTITQGGTNPVLGGAIYDGLSELGSGLTSLSQTMLNKQDRLTFDTTPTADSSNPVTSGGVYTALQNLPTGSGDVTTNTDQNITGTKTFVGSKKVAFKQSATNDKLGFTLFGNTGTERGYLEFNPTNTVDGVAGLMTLGNYATSAAGLTQVGFRRYSNISGASGAYNLLMPMVADAKTPFSLTTSYLNFYLPLGFTDGTTTVRTAKSGLVDLSPLLASLEARIAALEGN